MFIKTAKSLVILVSLASLGGCAIPVPVKIASWVMDGISMITTDKSVVEHGLSAALDQDCKVVNAFQGDDICQKNDPDTPEIAIVK